MGIWYLSVSVGSKTCTSLHHVSSADSATVRYLQLVRDIGSVEVVSHVEGEFEVTTSVEPHLLTVDIDRSLIVDSAEVEQNAVFARPVRWDVEGSLEPAIEMTLLHDT